MIIIIKTLLISSLVSFRVCAMASLALRTGCIVHRKEGGRSRCSPCLPAQATAGFNLTDNISPVQFFSPSQRLRIEFNWRLALHLLHHNYLFTTSDVIFGHISVIVAYSDRENN